MDCRSRTGPLSAKIVGPVHASSTAPSKDRRGPTPPSGRAKARPAKRDNQSCRREGGGTRTPNGTTHVTTFGRNFLTADAPRSVGWATACGRSPGFAGLRSLSAFPDCSSGWGWTATRRLQLRGQPRHRPQLGRPHRVPVLIPWALPIGEPSREVLNGTDAHQVSTIGRLAAGHPLTGWDQVIPSYPLVEPHNWVAKQCPVPE